MRPTLAALSASEDWHYSQYGEAAMVDWLLRRLKIEPAYVVEFGASTGPELSNTWHLAEAGALGLYLEADHERWLQLCDAVDRDLPQASAVRATVVDIDPWLHYLEPDVMSIDVDGTDLEIFGRMAAQPRIVIVEHHPMVPLPVVFYGGEGFGASAQAVIEMGSRKGYVAVGMTNCNTILVRSDLPGLPGMLAEIETDPRMMFDPEHVTFAVSNVQTGDYQMIGTWPFGHGEEIR